MFISSPFFFCDALKRFIRLGMTSIGIWEEIQIVTGKKENIAMHISLFVNISYKEVYILSTGSIYNE